MDEQSSSLAVRELVRRTRKLLKTIPNDGRKWWIDQQGRLYVWKRQAGTFYRDHLWFIKLPELSRREYSRDTDVLFPASNEVVLMFSRHRPPKYRRMVRAENASPSQRLLRSGKFVLEAVPMEEQPAAVRAWLAIMEDVWIVAMYGVRKRTSAPETVSSPTSASVSSSQG